MWLVVYRQDVRLWLRGSVQAVWRLRLMVDVGRVEILQLRHMMSGRVQGAILRVMVVYGVG